LSKKLQKQADIGDQPTFTEQCIQKAYRQIKGF